MTTLLVDNYDSYTYNVFHILAAVSGEEPIVIQNDTVSWGALSRWDFDAIVISPGPGHPDRWHDFGVCSDILRWSEVPILGICLGHQGLGRLLNGVVGAAPLAMHGRMSHVRHLGSGLFEGIPQDFSVVRYHSLAVTGPIGPEGRVTAWTEDGVVMGIEHRYRPIWGVQFHPESVSTEYGPALIENFYAMARAKKPQRSFGVRRLVTPSQRPQERRRERGAMRLLTRTIEAETPTEPVFHRLFGEAEHAFWLDSADAPTRLAQASYMGGAIGPQRCLVEYDAQDSAVTVHRGEQATVEHSSIFDALERELAHCAVEAPEGIARGLLSGFVGYLGYECKADCGSRGAHRSDLPDAMLMLADRVVAVDHVGKRTHLLAVYREQEGESDEREQAETWLDEAELIVRDAQASAAAGLEFVEDLLLAAAAREAHPDAGEQVVFNCGRGRRQYLADILRCQAALAAGESYEVCLTDQISTDASPDPLHLYGILRRTNPAPFAAYLKLGEIAIVSSSPERFLSVDRDGGVQARPIKGTAPRSADAVEDEAIRERLLSDEKTFAEHLMIVDLLRNDLGRVCEVGSVRVSEFIAGERYRTVHQLTSTIEGDLAVGRTPVDCVRACFPGGSMTGAPKLRTMEIIDDIEREARGVYSGGLGYFGLDGSVDLSIVIRTIVLRPGRTTIGAGGAIVMQSDPEDEFEELLLKARAPMAAVAQAVTGSSSSDSWRVEREPHLAATEAPA
jgi:para-aminobenzoate synthetase